MTQAATTRLLCSACAITLDTHAPQNPDWQTHKYFLDTYQTNHHVILRSPHGSRHGSTRQPTQDCDVCHSRDYDLLWEVTAYDVADTLSATRELTACSTCSILLTHPNPWPHRPTETWRTAHPTATVTHACDTCDWWTMRRCDICNDRTNGSRHHLRVTEYI